MENNPEDDPWGDNEYWRKLAAERKKMYHDMTNENDGYQGYLNRIRTEAEEPDPLREHNGKWCNLFFATNGDSYRGNSTYSSEGEAFDDAIQVQRDLKNSCTMLELHSSKVVLVHELSLPTPPNVPKGYHLRQLAWVTQIPIKE